jgi:hypothetical protein
LSQGDGEYAGTYQIIEITAQKRPDSPRLSGQRSLRKRFGTELLLKGTHRNPNEHPSIIHFSLTKQDPIHQEHLKDVRLNMES